MAMPDRLTELVTAECFTLTAARPDAHGIAVSEMYVDARRGAYLKSCTEVLFEATSVAELCANIRAANLHADAFRVSIVKKPRNLKMSTMELGRQIGGGIGGKPNLTHPKVVFLTVVTQENIWFGRLLAESDGAWLAHNQRPHVTSSSLPARLAQVLVNLVAGDTLMDRPSTDEATTGSALRETGAEFTLLEPCCGTGTIVLSAAHIGIKTVGYDINPRMVGATTKNLAHFGLNAEVQLGDAREIRGEFSAIATDLPYGIALVKDTFRDAEILENLQHCAPKIGLIDIRDMRQPLVDAGYRIETIIPVPKLSIVRRVFIATRASD